MATRKTPSTQQTRQAHTGGYTVEGDVMHYTTKAGHVLSMDLDFPAVLLAKAVDGDKDESEQFDAIRETFGENFNAAYTEMGALERVRVVKTFFIEWQKAAGLPLGESLSSSVS